MIRDSQRASEIIENTRSMLAHTGGKLETFELDEFIDETLGLLEHDLERSGTTVNVEKETTPPVKAVRIELQQVLINLLTNAIQAMDEAGIGNRTITVRKESQDADTIRVIVRDNGPGIAAEIKEKLFSPFFTTKATGMGMGLSICRTTLEARGGRLDGDNHPLGGAVLPFPCQSARRLSMPEARKISKEPPSPVVFIVDDDISMREALTDLFRSMKFDAEAFESTAAFLESQSRPAWLSAAGRAPSGISGLDFQMQMDRIGNRMPIIFMTGFGDIPMSVRAMKAGAVDFLTKPFKEQDILDAVATAMERDASRRLENAQNEAVASLAEQLTPREREVMGAVVRGLMNKQIAYELGISEVTVKLHRGNVMRKMEARSVADLVRKAELLG